MTTVAAELPDDIEALKALVLAARSENAVLAAEAAALRAAKADADARAAEGTGTRPLRPMT